MVPGLLLLLARDLALHDPPRVLAWRLTHDPRVAEAAGWLGPLLPAPGGGLDRDPVALLLAALATLLALAYALLAAAGARPAVRAGVIGLGAVLLVVLPSAAFIGLGAATDRPYGQDGGVVQLPLAIDKILAGESPYGADYSGTILARQARVSTFWDELGGNPILRHHAYLPGTHLVMLPFHLAGRALFGGFDPRVVTLLFYALVIALAVRFPVSVEGRLCAAGIAALNPLVYWHQIFGANDLVFVAMILGAVLLAREPSRIASGLLLGLACATKQLAWPFAPFLLVSLCGARSFRDLAGAAAWRRLLGPAAAAAAVFVAVVVPIAALDFRAFWGDIVVYNVGLPGGDNYPFGGTPGFGFANFLLYFGRVADLRDYFPFSVFYALLVPLGFLLLRAQLRDGHPEWALATGSTALVASLYFSRVVHPNYLIPAAVVLPLAVLARRRGADVALAPLLLLALAVEMAEGAIFRTAWEQASAADLPARLGGLVAVLAPKASARRSRRTRWGFSSARLPPASACCTWRSPSAALPVASGWASRRRRRSSRSACPPSSSPGSAAAPASCARRTRPSCRRRPTGDGSSRCAAPTRSLTRPPLAAARPFRRASDWTRRRRSCRRGRSSRRVRPCSPASPGLSECGTCGSWPSSRSASWRPWPRSDSRGVGAEPRWRSPCSSRPWRSGRYSGRPSPCRWPRSWARGPPAGAASLWVPGCWPARPSPSTTTPLSSSRSWCSPSGIGEPSAERSPAPSSRTSWWSLPWRSSTPAPSSSDWGSASPPALASGSSTSSRTGGRKPPPEHWPSPRSRRSCRWAIVVWLLRRPWPTLALGGIASLFGIVLAPAISAEAVAVPLVLLGLAAMEPGDEPSGYGRKDRQASAP